MVEQLDKNLVLLFIGGLVSLSRQADKTEINCAKPTRSGVNIRDKCILPVQGGRIEARVGEKRFDLGNLAACLEC